MTETYHGKPCRKYGHTERYVKSGQCVVCAVTRSNKERIENPEKHKALQKKFQKKWRDKNLEKVKTYNKKYKKENRGLYNHHQALRRARIKQQTPPWANLDKIKEIFINCPKGYEVDHIHPLSKGGLHVDYNLQHLSISENRRKHNTIL